MRPCFKGQRKRKKNACKFLKPKLAFSRTCCSSHLPHSTCTAQKITFKNEAGPLTLLTLSLSTFSLFSYIYWFNYLENAGTTLPMKSENCLPMLVLRSTIWVPEPNSATGIFICWVSSTASLLHILKRPFQAKILSSSHLPQWPISLTTSHPLSLHSMPILQELQQSLSCLKQY